MYFIEKEEELLGKEIVFTYFQQAHGEAMAIVTKDKGIFIFEQSDWGFEIYDEFEAKQYIFDEDDLADELNKLNIIPNDEITEYKKQLEERRRKEREKYNQQQEERDYREYLRLKEKYEEV